MGAIRQSFDGFEEDASVQANFNSAFPICSGLGVEILEFRYLTRIAAKTRKIKNIFCNVENFIFLCCMNNSFDATN